MAEQNEYIKEAYECLEKMSADERKRREYEERQKILWDHNSFMKSAKIIGIREGREEGRKEGRKEGREEGRKEGYREALVSIVIKKLQKGMSAEEIHKRATQTKETTVENRKKVQEMLGEIRERLEKALEDAKVVEQKIGRAHV